MTLKQKEKKALADIREELSIHTQATLPLPYKPITEIANRQILRDYSTRGRETSYIEFKLLKIREGFNLRKEYSGIEDLANFIEVNGLPSPLVVDMLKTGTCLIEQGHRRYKALELLKARHVLKSLDLPGIRGGTVECFVNNLEVDELTRLKRQYSSNNGEKFTPLELGELCLRLKNFFNLTQEEIGLELAMSRQSVKNMMIIAGQPDNIKQAIKSKNITPTAAVDLTRKIKDADKRNGIVQEAVSSGKSIGTSDVKRIIGDKDLREIEDGDTEVYDNHLPIVDDTRVYKPQFDESRLEIQQCNSVIRTLDKLYGMIGGAPDAQRLVEFMQADMEQIRSYIHKNKKQ